jgi:hypothetical protein
MNNIALINPFFSHLKMKKKELLINIFDYFYINYYIIYFVFLKII